MPLQHILAGLPDLTSPAVTVEAILEWRRILIGRVFNNRLTHRLWSKVLPLPVPMTGPFVQPNHQLDGRR
jgi:hypothetical protein